MELLGKFFVWVGVGLLKLCDTIFELFKVLGGVTPIVTKNGKEHVNILSFFTSGNTISKTFFYIMMVSIVIGGIFTMLSIVKNMVTLKKTQQKIVAQYLGSIVGTIICFIALIFVFMAVGQILALIDTAFKLGAENKNSTVGSRIMELLVQQAEENMGVAVEQIENRRQKHPINFNGKSITAITDEIMGLYKQNPYTGLEDIKKAWSKNPFSLSEYNSIRQFFPYAILLVTGFTFLFCSFGAVFALCVRLFDIVFLQFAMLLCLGI